MRFRRFFQRAQWDRERLREIESYVQIETDENVARGMPYEDALAAARKKFGNTTRVREEIYRINTISFFDTLERNVRYGLRMLRRNRMFTAVALVTLAIGIGANTAVFSVVNSVLLKPLNYPQPDRLVALRQVAPGAAGLASFADGLLLSPSMYFTYSEHNHSFQSMGVWAKDTGNVTGLAEPEEVRVIDVSDGVLQTLDVPPAAGRWLTAADQIPNGEKTVMLSYGYWQRRFAGQPSAIGRTLHVDSQARKIVGVMPKGFRVVTADFDLLVPAAFNRNGLILAGFGYNGIARLKPGATISRADADVSRLVSVWMDSWTNGPGTNPHWYANWRITPAFRPLKDEVVGNVGNTLWVVMGTIGLVMLIACANVTNLFLVRADARQQELAVRAALGAGWVRMVHELLVESVLLGLLGGIFAVGLAYSGLELLRAIGPADLPRLNEISLDFRSLAFTLALSLLSSMFFGLIPALKYAGPQIALALRSAGRNASVSRERHRARNILVIAQVAMALVLLISAGLMIRTSQALRTVDPGFSDAQYLQTMRISIPDLLVPGEERVTRMQNAILNKAAAIPGVSSVGFGSEMPMEGIDSEWDEIQSDEQQVTGILPLRLYKYASPGFLHTAGTRLLIGRELTWNDIYNQRPVVLVSENLARELWGSPSAALGRRLREFKAMPWHEVIGVVQDVRENGLTEKAPEIVYWSPFMKYIFGRKEVQATRSVTFVIRSQRAGTQSFVQELQQAVWSVEPNLPVASVRTMQDVANESLSRTSFTLVMLAIAGAMALVLGVVGIYGVISYAVSQRRREIGIRLALGAQGAAVKKMFVRSALSLSGIGAGLGLVTAVALTRWMKSLLFGISPLDPLTYVAVPFVLAFAAALASYLPARRAATVDPVEALRAE